MQRRTATSRRFFYFLIVVSIIVALFYSTLLGLIILIADIGYYYYLGRGSRRLNQIQVQEANYTMQKETTMEKEATKVQCKYCNAFIDPTNNSNCPNCGAPLSS